MSDTLKIIINHDCVKREIVGPFEICLDANSLRILKQRLEEVPPDHSYGWITIYEKPIVKGMPGTKALPWTSASTDPIPATSP